MTDEDDFGSAGYDRLATLLAGVISAIPTGRPMR